MPTPKASAFLPAFLAESDKARCIVAERDSEGRNAAIAAKDQFPSTVFVLDMIRMKLARAQSYLAAGNLPKFCEEMQDSSNYSLFAIVFEVYE